MDSLASHDETTPTPACLRCLVVDDDPLIRLCVQTMVLAGGHSADVAVNGADAIARIAREDFDVVISDIRMPELDGWSLFQHLRKVSPHTDVILMTAYATVTDAMTAMKLGACDYLPKPIDAEELTAQLAGISARRAADVS